MNTKLLLLAVSAAALSSCSTAYKSGQTPDDVYFSPVRTYEENNTRRDDNRNIARDYDMEERQIRMGVNNRRWRYFDNDINYNPYLYGYNYGYYYNPYYSVFPVYNPVVVVVNNPKNTTPRRVNLGGYGSGYNNTNPVYNPKTGAPAASRPVRTYNNSNGSRLGNALNKIFAPSNSNNNNSNSNNSNRTYTPSSSGTRSSSGSSSGSTISRPVRSGGRG